MKQSMADIEGFLELKRMAMVGVSRDPKHLSRYLYREFAEREYELYPVNPQTDEVEGHKCYPAVHLIDPAPESAMIILSGQKAENAVRECLDQGIQNIWVYGVRGPKDVDPSVLKLVEESGVNFVAGFCPFMFLEDVEWGHRAHAWIWRLLGIIPKKEKA